MSNNSNVSMYFDIYIYISTKQYVVLYSAKINSDQWRNIYELNHIYVTVYNVSF